MSQKKETLLLFLASVIPILLIFSGLWVFKDTFSLNPQDNQTGNSFNDNPVNNKCSLSNLPKGTFNYGGSTTWATIRRDVDPQLSKLCPEFSLRYVQPPAEKPGSGVGIKMLIANQLAFSQSSRSVEPAENLEAQQKGFSLKEIPVAIDAITFAVNHNLNIPGLTVEQIKDIYTGKITNWQQVGGPNLKITPLTRSQEAGGTVQFFLENVLENQSFGNNIQYIVTTTEALRKVAEIPGAIYYASAPELVAQCSIKPLPIGRSSQQFIAPYQEPYILPSQCPVKVNQLNRAKFRSGDYPITRNLFVIVKQDGGDDQKAGEGYANWLQTSPAQQLLEKAGFVRIK